jgi:tetratricopeptide (TPR) repeat protein
MLAAGSGTTTVAALPVKLNARAIAAGQTPIEHLRKVRQLLIDNDNLLGPRQVISMAYEQIKVIQALRSESNGADRRRLLELQTQFAEFAAWLHQDAGEFRRAEYWLDRALQWSHSVGDQDLTCFVMARKSQLAAEMQDVTEVVDLAEAAQRIARPGTRLATVSRTYEGLGHALRGELSASARAFDEARSSLENIAEDPSPWAAWLDTSYVEVHRAQGLDKLGEHTQSAEVFALAISGLPSTYYRDRGVYLAREAVAHVGAAEPEQAATAGLQSIHVAVDTGSGRIFRELAKLDTALQRWNGVPEVDDFRTALDGVVLHETREPI